MRADTTVHTLIVYLDDARHALQTLGSAPDPAGVAAHWILVACPPRMTRHLSKWVNQRQREQWRNRWAEKQFSLLRPALQTRGHRISTVLADAPLPEFTRALRAREGPSEVLDLRRPKFDAALPAPRTGPDTLPQA